MNPSTNAAAAAGHLYCHQLAAQARTAPDKDFLLEGERRLTYADTVEAVERLAATLSRHGVQSGARCVLWMENGIDYVLAWLALARTGAVSVPLNQAYRGPILAHQINDVNPQAIVTDAAHWARIAELGASVKPFARIFHGSRSGESGLPEGALPLFNDNEPLAAVGFPCPQASDIMSIFYTSGTTGPSKGVLYTHEQAWNTALSVSPHLAADDVFYMTNPMCHVGLPHCLGAVLQAGATMAIRKKFSASGFWSDVRRYGATATMMLGSVASFLNSAKGRADDADHTLRKVLMVPMLKDADAFCRRFGVSVMSWFNMTELSVPLDTGGFSPHPDGGCGHARPGVSARVVDELDREVPRGLPGELVVRDDRPWTISPGYLDQPDATAATWRNLWFHTGDLFVQDEAGAFFFLDRLKDCIRRRGENISSHEVESQILLNPMVQEAAVIGVAAPDGEQEVQAIIVLRPGAQLDTAALLDFLQPRLPHFCIPRYIAFNADPLPKTETGKVQKNLLRARFPRGKGDREDVGYILRR